MGRRGLVLMLFGLAWLIYGGAVVLTRGEMGAGGEFVHEKMPMEAQAALWLGSGAMAILAALVHRGRSDTFGYLAAFLPPMILGSSYLLGSLSHAAEGSFTLAALGIFGVALWGDLATIIGVCASWPEEPMMPGGEGNE